MRERTETDVRIVDWSFDDCDVTGAQLRELVGLGCCR